MTFQVTVPNAPGVPAVAFTDDAISAGVALLTADLLISGQFLGTQWGLFQNGSPIIVADSVSTVDFKEEWSISDHPVERGAFASYDKVAIPYDFRIRYTAGSFAQRAALIASIAAVAGTTAIFDAVEPEAVHPSVTLSHYDYRRTARSGLGLLQVDVWCLWVQQVGASGITNATAPDGNDPQPGGAVQPAPVSKGVTDDIDSGVLQSTVQPPLE